MAHGQEQAQALGRVHQVVSLGQRRSERLLHEDVTAGLEGHPGDRVMGRRGDRDDQSITAGGKSCGIESIHRQAARHLKSPATIAVRYPDELAVRYLAQNPCVGRSESTYAYDPDLRDAHVVMPRSLERMNETMCSTSGIRSSRADSCSSAWDTLRSDWNTRR